MIKYTPKTNCIETWFIVHLPCLVNDIIYMPWKYNGLVGIARLTVTNIRIFHRFSLDSDYFCVETNLVTDDDGFRLKYKNGVFAGSDFGKIVFLTEEEASDVLRRSNSTSPREDL